MPPDQAEIADRWSGEALDLACNLEPWDRITLGWNTAVISAITVRSARRAAAEFGWFRSWCNTHAVRLVCSRLPQDRLVECAFLESQGFRFIELNYRPVLTRLAGFALDPEIAIVEATIADLQEVGSLSRNIQTGRFHADPQIDPAIGDRRFAGWLPNAFRNPSQTVLKMMQGGRICMLFVVETPAPGHRFWSLAFLTGPSGQGLGRRSLQTLIATQHAEGVTQISTSISSHNVVVHNLYASLGFRFPAPTITLHWCPDGPLTAL